MNMKSIFHNRFPNLGGKLKLDRNSDSDTLALPPYADALYASSKNDKEIYNELYKKMSTNCVQNYFVLEEKKMKKSSWETLSCLLSESEKKLSDDILTKEFIDNSIKTLDEMGRNNKEFERTLSSTVIKYFQDVSEDNTLLNTKKSLTSLSKEMKSISEKVQSLQDQLNNQPGESLSNRKSVDVSALAITESKLLSAQTIEENNEREWENKKDLYLTKLFAAEAEKVNTAEKLLEFFQCYLDYYTECEKTLSKIIPDLKSSLERHKHIFAFNAPLEDHLSATNRKLSYVLETCIQEMDNEDTLQHEGLFRISGGKSKMELLKNALNVMRVDDYITKGCSSAVYAGVLKQYLRELPIPLMTYVLYDRWCTVGAKIRQNDHSGTMELVKECLSLMPICYYDNLVYLMQFLKKISAYESVNKMSASNLGLMLGPNLIRNKQNSDGEDDSSAIMILGSPGGSVLEFMIAHFSELFPNAPVYPTAPKPDLSSNLSLNEKESEKNAKKLKQFNDDDSASSGDLKLEDNPSATGTDLTDSLRSEISLKSPREPPNNMSRSFRKAPAPPPPPPTKPYMVENEIKDMIHARPDSRPMIKKRMSKLEKPLSETLYEPDEYANDTRQVVTPRPNQAPSLPSKKPNVLPHGDVVERPLRPENPPPKRPNNPPPPIPQFDKIKEILDLKQHPENIRKQSLNEESSMPDTISVTDSLSASFTKKHQYSSSEGGNSQL